MFDQLTDLISGTWWSYLLLFGVAYFDALIPIVPSETSVITAGVLASSGDMNLLLVIICSASGAFVGDNTAYYIGDRWGERAIKRFLIGEKAKKRIAWAQRELEERGGQLIVVARFIPGGRTVVTLSAGSLEYAWRRFVVFAAIAATIWASYAALLGYFGGKAFEKQPWKGLILALVIAFAITGLIELIRWLRKRSRGGQPGLETK